jgi:hypothetical protein
MKFPIWLMAVGIAASSCNKDVVSTSQHFYQTYENIAGNAYAVDAVPIPSGFAIAALAGPNTWTYEPIILKTNQQGKTDTTWNYRTFYHFKSFRNFDVCVGLHPGTLIHDGAGALGVATYYNREKIPGFPREMFAKIEFINPYGAMDTCGKRNECQNWQIDNGFTFEQGYILDPNATRPALCLNEYENTFESLCFRATDSALIYQTFNKTTGQQLTKTIISTTVLSAASAVSGKLYLPSDKKDIEPYSLIHDHHGNVLFNACMKTWEESQKIFMYSNLIFRIKSPINPTSPELETMANYTIQLQDLSTDRIYGMIPENDTSATVYPVALVSRLKEVRLAKGESSADILAVFPGLDASKRMQLLHTPDKKYVYVLGSAIGGGISIYQYLYGNYEKPISSVTHGSGINSAFSHARVMANGDLIICGNVTQFGVNTKPFLMRVGADGQL